jgi:pSer/pThr/pTyr-binding forkhead associated (FHA) protein
MGSFAWVDCLAIHGVEPRQIRAIGFEEKPYSRLRRLCENSQIPMHERLRSDSGATPDNMWGWPGYAVREIWSDLKRGDLRHAIFLVWQIFGEPTLADPFTPKAGQVYASIEREARRIGWDKIWRFGRVRAIRQTDDGRYVVAYSQSTIRKDRPRLILANYLHLAVGYPRLRFLPDLQNYREQTGDFHCFVNAYEEHNQVYHRLRQHGGTALIRGRGIVASRIIQRLYEERQENPKISILHLMRGPIPAGSTYQQTQRLAEHHFELQPYNFPKACFGGDLLFELEQAGEQEQAHLIDRWGGTTTANRREWREIIDMGLKQGWYQIRFGSIERVERRNGRLTVLVCGQGAIQEKTALYADFIIDATGLDSDPEQSPLLKDLLETYHLGKNAKGKLKVSHSFEVSELQNGAGRVYASGIATAGGHFAPVDSFVGLQYAAQRSIESLIEAGAPGLRPLTPTRSVIQWLRWAAGARP